MSQESVHMLFDAPNTGSVDKSFHSHRTLHMKHAQHGKIHGNTLPSPKSFGLPMSGISSVDRTIDRISDGMSGRILDKMEYQMEHQM